MCDIRHMSIRAMVDVTLMVQTLKDIDMNFKSITLCSCIHSACMQHTVGMRQQTVVLDILRDKTFLEDNFAFYY